jgi:hypothetical protein
MRLRYFNLKEKWNKQKSYGPTNQISNDEFEKNKSQ